MRSMNRRFLLGLAVAGVLVLVTTLILGSRSPSRIEEVVERDASPVGIEPRPARHAALRDEVVSAETLPDFELGYQESLELPGSEDVPEPGAEIRGLVLEVSGDPVYRARLVLQRHGEIVPVDRTRTDDEGRFVFRGLEPGDYTVGCVSLDPTLKLPFSEGYLDSESLALLEGESAFVELSLGARRGCRLTGRITAAREPAPDALVQLYSMEEGGGGRPVPSLPRATRTDDQGLFALPNVSPGPYLLKGTLHGHPFTRSIEVPDAADHHVELPAPAGGVEVIVLDGITGDPVPSLVRIVPAGATGEERPDERGRRTDEEGVARFDFVGDGAYTVRICPNRTLLGEVPCHEITRRPFEVRSGETLRIEVALEEGYALTGEVRSLSGEPVPFAEVVVRDRDGHLLGMQLRSSADGDGSFRVVGLPPGASRVEARAADGATVEPVEVYVASGSPPVRLVLDRLPE